MGPAIIVPLAIYDKTQQDDNDLSKHNRIFRETENQKKPITKEQKEL